MIGHCCGYNYMISQSLSPVTWEMWVNILCRDCNWERLLSCLLSTVSSSGGSATGPDVVADGCSVHVPITREVTVPALGITLCEVVWRWILRDHIQSTLSFLFLSWCWIPGGRWLLTSYRPYLLYMVVQVCSISTSDQQGRFWECRIWMAASAVGFCNSSSPFRCPQTSSWKLLELFFLALVSSFTNLAFALMPYGHHKMLCM